MLSVNQINLLQNLMKKLSIKHFVFIGPVNFNSFKVLKYFSKLKIYIHCLTLYQMYMNIEYEMSKTSNQKTLALIENVYDDYDSLRLIFKEEKEEFLLLHTWVTFYNYDYDIEVINSIYIPYNCEFLYVKPKNDTDFEISELFDTKIFTRKLHATYFGKWTLRKNFEIPVDDFYRRRLDLNKTVLHVISIREVKHCEKDQGICVGRELINELGRIMNFSPCTVSFEEVDLIDEFNGTWLTHEIFISIIVFDADLYWRDAIGPLWKESAYLHIKFIHQYEEGDSAPYIRPFQTDLWISIAITVIIIGFTILGIDYTSQKHCLQEKNCNYIDSLLRPLESFMNSCGSQIPATVSSRIANLISWILPICVISLYSATILAFVTVRKVKFPFTDLKGLVEDGSFKIACENTTFLKYIFENTTDPLKKLAYQNHFLSMDKMPLNIDEAAVEICKDPKLALAEFDNVLFFEDLKCEVLQIPNPIHYAYAAIPLRDDSMYRIIFNRLLKSFASSGVLRKMQKTVYGAKPIYEHYTDFDPIEFESVWPIIKLIGCIYIFSVTIFLLEKIHYVKRK